MNLEPYIRKKGEKYVIEKKEKLPSGKIKTVYLKTLPSPKRLLELLRLGKKGTLASRSHAAVSVDVDEKFGQTLLNALSEEDNSETLKDTKPTEEEIQRLWEMSK